MIIGYISTSDQVIYGKTKNGHNIYKSILFNNDNNCLVSYNGKLKGKIIIILEITKTLNNLPYGNIIDVIGLMNNDNLYLTLQYIYNINRKNVLYKFYINENEYKIYRKFINKIIFSIDPKGSQDIDDAISYSHYDDYDIVNIYIAQPIYFLSQDILFNRAKKAFSTLYYNNNNNLWGDALTLQSSLLKKQLRPVYCISFKYINNDIIIDSYPCYIINTIQTNYDDCLNYKIINNFYNFTKKITNIIDTHELVSYWMILINNYIGNKYKYLNIPYRTIKESKINEFDYIKDENISLIFSNRVSEKANYTLEGDYYHCKLDKFNYTHFTSPIRRIIDTINHWCITYNINFKDLLEIYDITIDNINELDKNTKKFHNQIKLLDIINKLNDENEFTGWIYNKSKDKHIWTVYFKELGFQKVKIWDKKLDNIINKDFINNINVGDTHLYKVYKKNGFLVNDKILIIKV